MKIAAFVSQFPCPSETFILNQITGLIEKGHEVHIYAYTGWDIPENFVNIEKYNLDGKIFYFDHGNITIPKNKFIRLFKASGLVYQAGAKRAWSLLRTMNLFKYGKVAATLTLLYQGATMMRNGEYDIVHCHFGQNGKIAVALKDAGVIQGKVITTFYGFDLSEYIKKNGPNEYDFLFAKGDLCIAISDDMREQLTRLGCHRSKIEVHRLGVDLSRFIFSQRKTTNDCRIRAITVGRFVEKKGLEYGVRAIAEVVKKNVEISYIVIGDGELREELTHLISELNLKKQIQLLGWKTPEEVAILMGEADIFLAPSVTSDHGDQEGTPTVIIEALARGVPVLSTYHAGIPELVQDGRSGFLVRERDFMALAQKLEYLCWNSEKRCEMGKVGRDWVEQHHDIEKLNHQLVCIYEQLFQREVSCNGEVSRTDEMVPGSRIN